MVIWLNTGLCPWRLDGLSADTTDVPTLEYWAEMAGLVMGARNEATEYINSLPPEIRQSQARSRAIMRRAGQEADL